MKYARNWISIGGAAVTTLSAALFLIVFLLDALGFHTNPYIGIVVFLILPGFFIAGLVVIPIGMWFERRRQVSGRRPSKPTWPILDLNSPVARRTTMVVLVMTFLNVVIVSLAAYRGIEYMDSVQFCGQVCHTVMQPEYTAYQNGPHARVLCVQCHIGPGAPWFVKSKLSGVRQVFAVAAHTYSRPIPSPVTDLRPARDTCEQCHWPAFFHGDKVVTLREYAEDEANTESDTTLQLHIGGGGERADVGEGIHWHVNPGNNIRYWPTDDKRQVIGRVELTTPDGKRQAFTADGVTDAQLANIEPRTMDCIDCHNRPTHTFAASAAKAVDSAMADGFIATSLPYAKKEAVALLTAAYPTREQARDAIATGLTDFYRTKYPDVFAKDQAAVERAARSTEDLYDRNVFPDMNVTWGTYVNNIGHMDSPGCFRCHDGNHKTPDGQAIKQDCDLCHSFQ